MNEKIQKIMELIREKDIKMVDFKLILPLWAKQSARKIFDIINGRFQNG